MSEKRVRDFALGDGSYEGLSPVAVDALKRLAGYVPDVCGDDLPATLDEYDDLDSWFQGDFGVSLEEITSAMPLWWYDETLKAIARRDDRVFIPKLEDIHEHRNRPRINGVVQLPKMELEQPIPESGFKHCLLEWIDGRAWLAGGSVVGLFHGFQSDDYDLFCWTDDIYDEMVSEIRRESGCMMAILDENDRSILIENPTFDGHNWAVKLNLVKPDGEDWREPYNVLKDFDLSCSAMLLKNHSEAYVWGRLLIEQKLMTIITLKHPAKTLRRVLKYWGRGFEPTSAVWGKLSEDDRSAQLMKVIAPLTHVFNDSVQLEQIALAVGEIEPEYQSSFPDEYYDEYE